MAKEQMFRWTNQSPDFQLGGPEALRSYFFPRQVLQIQEAAMILGITREGLYKKLRCGHSSLRISKDPKTGRQFVKLEDLIEFLYPESYGNGPQPPLGSISASCFVLPEKKRGRPRGSKNIQKNRGNAD